MRNKSVVIADDDPNIVTALTLRCEQMGLGVRAAADAMTALSMIHADPPGLTILDVNMPAGNGLSVCEMLATDKHLESIPVIILSGRSDQNTIRRCKQLGAHYVQKGGDVWARLKPIMHQLISNTPDRSAHEIAAPSMTAQPCRPVVPLVPPGEYSYREYLLQTWRGQETALP